MAATFSLSYRDYLQQGQQRDSDGSPLFREDQWNALSDDAKWFAMGGQFNVTEHDSRYEGLSEATHPEPGRDIRVYGRPNLDREELNQWLVDPHRVLDGDNFVATPWDNHTPRAQYISKNAERNFL